MPVSFRIFKVAEKFLVQKQDFCHCLNLRLESKRVYTHIYSFGKDMVVPGTRHAVGRGEGRGRYLWGSVCIHQGQGGKDGFRETFGRAETKVRFKGLYLGWL